MDFTRIKSKNPLSRVKAKLKKELIKRRIVKELKKRERLKEKEKKKNEKKKIEEEKDNKTKKEHNKKENGKSTGYHKEKARSQEKSTTIKKSDEESKLLAEERERIAHKRENNLLKKEKKTRSFKRRLTNHEKKQRLENYLIKAGINTKPEKIIKGARRTAGVITALLTIIVIVLGAINKKDPRGVLYLSLSIITIINYAIYLLILGMIYFYLDIRIYRRTKQIEEVLPDFLQLTSANISAGMPIDKALWFAIRPNFGVLAKDIEEVAKATIAGEELKESLKNLTKKYNSEVLRRSINLLLEGLDSGGEMADLLNKISNNIQESRILKQEMSANVATYAIFITFASIVAAPLLFGLATQLLNIVVNIASKLDLSSMGGSFQIKISNTGEMISNFKTFCYMMLTVSSFFSASIVAVIRKGQVKEGISNIPVFIIISWILYYLSTKMLGTMLSGMLG